MAIQNYYVVTEAQRDALMVYDNEEVRLGARAIDQLAPGVGLNLSEEATGVLPGDAVSLIGKYIVPQTMMTNPDYLMFAPEMVTLLRTFPWCMLQDETIFLPQIDL